MTIHMAGQHFEHIVFGANQYACWLRCTLCEKISPRIYYRFTICMKCPGRRREEHEPLWHISTRCVLMKWNSLLLRLFWLGTEDMRAYFAQEIRDLSQRRQFVEVDDSETLEVFHDIIESDRRMTQASCDLRWAPLMRHAVLNEESTDSSLIPEVCQSAGSAQQPGIHPEDQQGTIRILDDPRAEVSLLTTEQDDTSLADRFSRGGLPFTVGQLHGGIAMEKESTDADIVQSDEDKLDETRSNEAHLRQAAYLQDPCSPQGTLSKQTL